MTGQPLARCRVEAGRVHIVAFTVVGGSHTVERRVEVLVLGTADGLAGLLERERDTTTLKVDVDDLDEDIVVDVNDLLGQFDVTLSKLGDVHQAFDALFDANECTERDQLGDLTGHNLTDLVRTSELLPRIFLRGLEGQRYALAIHVDVKNLDGDLGANFDNL